MFKTILIPIDVGHTDKSNHIISIAATNGNKDARIILLNVVEDIPKWAAIELPDGFQTKSLQDAKQQLDAIANASEINVEVDVRIGHPYQTILDTVKEVDADLIVIASHQPGLQDYLLGSTAAKVVRHAKCSVLVVR
ncbi:MAG: universal stress protein [Gammaproteobacteria bacterium]|nr:universal stress protein [Gammaproteobacteria bacterium]